MKYSTTALVFPETEPSAYDMAKFLLFFDALSYYLPTESDAANNKDNNFFSGLCTGYVPAPLGDDLVRFNLLLRDMGNSRPEELSRLFSTAKAPVATGQVRDQDETSASSIFAAMQMDAETQTGILHKERLWQARLILKLAEMLDRRKTEVRKGLSHISSVEQKVFASLEGAGGSSIDGPADLSSPGKFRHPKEENFLPDEPLPGTSGQLISLRLKAWAELYLADSADRFPAVLAAANPESGVTLLDGYENTWRRMPQKLFSLSIPTDHLGGVAGTVDRYLESRRIFRQAAQENLKYFAGLIQETACSEPDNLEKNSLLAENVSTWDEKLRVHFPAAEKSFGKLDFYCFPGTSLAEIFQRLFHLEGPIPANRREHPTGLLAILRP